MRSDCLRRNSEADQTKGRGKVQNEKSGSKRNTSGVGPAAENGRKKMSSGKDGKEEENRQSRKSKQYRQLCYYKQIMHVEVDANVARE